MIFRTDSSAPPPSPRTTEEQYVQRLAALTSVTRETELPEVLAVLQEAEDRYRQRGHLGGAQLSRQNITLIRQLVDMGVPAQGPAAFTQESIQLMFSTSERVLAYEIALQWWPLYGEDFWDRLRIKGEGIVPAEDEADSHSRRQMRMVLAALAPFARLAAERPGVSASVIGLSILRNARLLPSVAIFPQEWISHVRQTATWLRAHWQNDPDFPKADVDLVLDALTSAERAAPPTDDIDLARAEQPDSDVPASHAPHGTGARADARRNGSDRDEPPPEAVVFALNREAMACIRRGAYARAIELGAQARDIARRRIGEDSPHYAMCLNAIATAHEEMGDHAAAHPLFVKIVALIRVALGEQSLDHAHALNNLAKLEAEMGQTGVAEGHYREALKIFRAAGQPIHPAGAATMNNLAQLYLQSDRHEEAESLFREALSIRHKALGAHHPEYASSLQHVGACLLERGRFADAVPLYREALQIRESSLGETDPSTLRSFHELAGLHAHLGEYKAAQTLLHRLLELRRRTGGEDALFLEVLTDLVHVCTRNGDLTEGAQRVREALALRTALHGEESSEFATLLNMQGQLLLLGGKHAQAQTVFWRAIAIDVAVSGEQSAGYARDLVNLGEAHRALGDFASASECYQRALDISSQNADVAPTQRAAALNNQAELYRVMGRYDDAASRYHQAIQIFRTEMGEHHPDHISVLHNLALLHRATGNVRAALELGEQVVDAYRKALGPNHPAHVTALANLGTLQVTLGDYDSAEKHLKEVIEIRRRTLGEGHPDYAVALDSLGTLHAAKGDLAGAQPLIRAALEVYRAAFGSAHPEVAISLHNIASLYLGSGHPAVAAEFLVQLEPVLEAGLASESPHPKWANVLSLWGRVFSSVGNHRAAEPLVRQAISLQEQTLGSEHPGLVDTLQHLATICAGDSRRAEAISLLERASAIADRMIEQVLASTSERRRMAYLATIRTGHDLFLSLVALGTTPASSTTRAAVDLVLRRKAIGAEVLAIQRDSVLYSSDRELRANLSRLRALRAQIAAKVLAGPGPEGLRAHQEILDAWQQQRDTLEAALARRIPQLSLERRLRTTSVDTVASALPPDTALVEIVRFTPYDFSFTASPPATPWKSARYLTFIVTGSGPDDVHVIDLGEADTIDDLIRALRADITGEAESRSGRRDLKGGGEPTEDRALEHGAAIRERTFDRWLPYLSGRTRLLLAPDSEFTRLPFKILPAVDGSHLIEQYSINYLSCGRDLLRFEARPAVEPSAPVVIGDPDFDLELAPSGPESGPNTGRSDFRGRQPRELERGHLFFERLPGTRAEARHVAALLGIQPWIDGEALEGRFKDCRSPRILHLATHGFFLHDVQMEPKSDWSFPGLSALDPLSRAGMDNPLLRSGLALAGANTWLKRGTLPADAQDGLLTAEDVSGLDLWATDLVVLSACETGLGEIRVGEGVLGLRRSFVLAGARVLITSLWKVPDEQTKELMLGFYDRMLRGETVGTALRSAQLEMQKKHPNPYYWGAFVCQGDPALRCASCPESG